MKVFLPEYGNYYHFISESAMGLYRLLRDAGQLAERNCEIWYGGKYAPIVQLFSRHPVNMLCHPEDLPAGIGKLNHRRPKTDQQWAELKPLYDYFDQLFPPGADVPGVTVIKRVTKRVYAAHDDLVRGLAKFGIPVREAILEGLSFESQINLMRSTRLLITPHGSGLTNLPFLPPNARILELYPMGFTDRIFGSMARVFGYVHIELESTIPSVIGRMPPPRVQEFLETRGWPSRSDFLRWRPDPMEMGRVLRDVASFDIDPAIVLAEAARLM